MKELYAIVKNLQVLGLWRKNGVHILLPVSGVFFGLMILTQRSFQSTFSSLCSILESITSYNPNTMKWLPPILLPKTGVKGSLDQCTQPYPYKYKDIVFDEPLIANIICSFT